MTDHPIIPSDAPILTALARHYLLTPAQLCRLCFAYPGSLKYAYDRCKRLADGGHLVALDTKRPTRRGMGPIVYALNHSGLAHLKAMGVDVPERSKVTEVREHSYLYFAHTLAVNDVLIALELLCRQTSQVTIQAWLHERTLKHRPVVVPLGSGTKVSLIPDAFVVPRVEMVDGTWRIPLAFEIDLGTTERKAWQQKIRAYLASYGEQRTGPLLTAFGVSSLTVAIVTPLGERRRAQLHEWTEGVLTETGTERFADLFRFIGADAPNVSPRDLFTAPVWSRPFGREPVPLLEPKGGG
jgi:hypothetical protein